MLDDSAWLAVIVPIHPKCFSIQFNALCTGALSCWNRKGPSPNCFHEVGSTEWSKMSLYAVALRFPFNWTKGPSLNHEKQPQAVIPPPPSFTVGTMYRSRWRSPSICQTQINLSDCQMVKRDSSFQRTRFHCSRVQWLQALHHCSQCLALRMVILGLCAAIAPRGSLELGIECCNRGQTSAQLSCSLTLCGLPLHSWAVVAPEPLLLLSRRSQSHTLWKFCAPSRTG